MLCRGSEVVAGNDGKVIYSGYYGSYGNAVIIDHGGKISTLYAHNDKLLVKEGATVKKGQAIAKSGSTGLSTGPHLHFEVRENGQCVDPMKYLGNNSLTMHKIHERCIFILNIDIGRGNIIQCKCK